MAAGLNITKEFLEEQYLTLNKKTADIAKELQCSMKTVQYYIFKYKLFKLKTKLDKLTKEILEDLYIKNGLTVQEIRKLMNVSFSTVSNRLKKHGIEIRGITGFPRTRLDHCSKRRKGYMDICARYWRSQKKHAKNSDREFSISIEYIWDLYEKQNRKCALTGLDIKFVYYQTMNSVERQTASIDRIDSTKGYIEGNIQLVHKDYNKLKNDFPQDEFIKMCENVVNYSKSGVPS